MRMNFKYQHQNVLRFLMTCILKCHNESPVSLSTLKKIKKLRKSLLCNGKHKYLVYKNFRGRNPSIDLFWLYLTFSKVLRSNTNYIPANFPLDFKSKFSINVRFFLVNLDFEQLRNFLWLCTFGAKAYVIEK